MINYTETQYISLNGAVERIKSTPKVEWIFFEKDGVEVEFVKNDRGEWLNILTDPAEFENDKSYIRAIYTSINDVINFIRVINTDNTVKNFDMY